MTFQYTSMYLHWIPMNSNDYSMNSHGIPVNTYEFHCFLDSGRWSSQVARIRRIMKTLEFIGIHSNSIEIHGIFIVIHWNSILNHDFSDQINEFILNSHEFLWLFVEFQLNSHEFQCSSVSGRWSSQVLRIRRIRKT